MLSRLTNLSSALLGATRIRLKSEPPPAAPAATSSTESSEPLEESNDGVRQMKCTRTDSATECTLQLEGSLDVHSAPEIRAVFDSVVAARHELVIIDLERLTMLDSSGVGAIVSLFKRVKAFGGHVVVKNVQNQPLAVCKLLKLDRIFGL